MSMVWTVKYFGSTEGSETVSEECLETVLVRPLFALTEGEDGADAKTRVEWELKKRRASEEAVVGPHRERWQRENPGSPVVDINLCFVQVLPICPHRWEVTEGKNPEVRYNLDLTRKHELL